MQQDANLNRLRQQLKNQKQQLSALETPEWKSHKADLTSSSQQVSNLANEIEVHKGNMAQIRQSNTSFATDTNYQQMTQRLTQLETDYAKAVEVDSALSKPRAPGSKSGWFKGANVPGAKASIGNVQNWTQRAVKDADNWLDGIDAMNVGTMNKAAKSAFSGTGRFSWLGKAARPLGWVTAAFDVYGAVNQGVVKENHREGFKLATAAAGAAILPTIGLAALGLASAPVSIPLIVLGGALAWAGHKFGGWAGEKVGKGIGLENKNERDYRLAYSQQQQYNDPYGAFSSTYQAPAVPGGAPPGSDPAADFC